MRNLVFIVRILAITVSLVTVFGGIPSNAQSVFPRTPWGTPDLQGIWDFRTITPLQRPTDLAGQEFLTEEEAAQREQAVIDRNETLLNAPPRTAESGENVGAYNNFWMDRGTRVIGTRRTSLIIDPTNGRLPTMTEAGQERASRRGSFGDELATSYVDLSNPDRCIMGFNAGPPMTPGGYNQNMQLFQTAEYVVILNEMVHNARIIPLDGRPGVSGSVPQWSGDSRGYWEGDTLVIKTDNFNGPETQRRWRGSSKNMTLVERITRLDNGTLEYEFTVTDPETWESSWTASTQMLRTDVPMYEYACHEGNYGLFNILAGARIEELGAEVD